jgi:hypothetical protein
MESVIEFEIVPPVSMCDRMVDPPMDPPQFHNIRVRAMWIMNKVVRIRQPSRPCQHQLSPDRVKATPEVTHILRQLRERQSLEHIRRRVSEVRS